MMAMLRMFTAMALVMLTLVSSGCTRLVKEMATVEQPRIDLASVKVLPAMGSEQRVELGLRVVNPNGFDLEVRAMMLDVRFNDLSVLNGVTSDIPLIPAYSEVHFPVNVSASLINSLRLVQILMEHPEDPLHYRLEARIDLKRYLRKRISIRRQGVISARPAPAAPAASAPELSL